MAYPQQQFHGAPMAYAGAPQVTYAGAPVHGAPVHGAPVQYAAPQTYAGAPVTYAAPMHAAPQATYAAAPQVTYAAAPQVTYAAAPQVAYAAAQPRGIDWAAVNAALPYERTPDAKARRNKLFREIDCNGNDYLSLAEVDKGMRDYVKLLEIFDSKPVMMRAFQAAKNYGGDTTGVGPDYIEKKEFRIFLQYMRSYFELYEMYQMIDVNSDRHVTRDEFCTAAPMLAQWGLQVNPAELPSVFDQIDTNNGGVILFTEFADWAIANKLDLGEEDNRPVQGPAHTAVSYSTAPAQPVHMQAAAPAYAAAPVVAHPGNLMQAPVTYHVNHAKY